VCQKFKTVNILPLDKVPSNPLTPGAFSPECILDILEISSLDISQIGSNLLKMAFYDIFAQAFTEIKFGVIYLFRLFRFFLFFLRFFFFCFSNLLMAVIDLLLGLLPIQKSLRSAIITGTME